MTLLIRIALVGMVISCPIGAAHAQTERSAPSPINDLIQQTRDQINRFRYDSARVIAREVMSYSSLRREQESALYQLMAAVFYPEEGGTPQPDSARWYLTRSIKLMPDAALDPAIKWSGLDSLFRVVRSGTFASVVRPNEDNALTGVDGHAFVDVISTRPAAMSLQTISRSTGIVTTHDSTPSGTRARLGLRAHNGEQPNFVSGEYEMRVIVRDLVTGSADTARYNAYAIGSPPALQTVPAVNPGALLPEHAPLARVKGIVAGVVLGGATYALSRYARAGAPLRDEYPADTRARGIGVVVGLGAIVGGYLDKGRPLPENVAANTITRAEAERAATVVRDANRKLISEYRVEFHIDMGRGR